LCCLCFLPSPPPQIADLAIGFSGAELANLLNEAAILAVS
jgi:ATP-dependent Zn protease